MRKKNIGPVLEKNLSLFLIQAGNKKYTTNQIFLNVVCLFSAIFFVIAAFRNIQELFSLTKVYSSKCVSYIL